MINFNISYYIFSIRNKGDKSSILIWFITHCFYDSGKCLFHKFDFFSHDNVHILQLLIHGSKCISISQKPYCFIRSNFNA